MKNLKLSHEQLGFFCRSLGQMYHAGIIAADALALMAEDESSPPEKKLLQNMSSRADEGLPLARVFREAGCFPEYMCSLMLVGERLGRSEDTLNALADYYQGRARLERELKNALLYPCVLLLVLLCVLVILLVWVLPIFNDVYARLGSSLSGLAGGLLAFGQVLRKAMPALCVLLAALLCLALALSVSDVLRERLLSAWRQKFGDKGIGRKINGARFIQALAMGLSGGLTETEAAELAADLSKGNRGFQRRCGLCAEKLRAGDSLGSALAEAGMLSRAQCRLLETGKRAGNQARVMEQLAEKALEDTEHELAGIAGRVEPAVVILMSVLVGMILLSVMLPLMRIMAAIS